MPTVKQMSISETYCLILSFLGPNLGPDGPLLKAKYRARMNNESTKNRTHTENTHAASSWTGGAEPSLPAGAPLLWRCWDCAPHGRACPSLALNAGVTNPPLLNGVTSREMRVYVTPVTHGVFYWSNSGIPRTVPGSMNSFMRGN